MSYDKDNCRNCRWGKFPDYNPDGDYGACVWRDARLPISIFVHNLPIKEYQGEDCPCWEKKDDE